MTLEKAKTKKKITKSQLQKQKQVQNVIVNLQAPVKKTRKRTTRPKPVQIPPKQSLFQAPTYMTPIASLNPKPTQDNNSILSDILKIIKPTKVEDNELEKTKLLEREAPKQPKPTLPPSLGAPQRIPSLVDEIRSDPFNTKQTFINTPVYEAPQQPFKLKTPLKSESKSKSIYEAPLKSESSWPSLAFEKPLQSESKFIYEAPLKSESSWPSLAFEKPLQSESKFIYETFETPLHPKPLPQSLLQQIKVGQEKKFEPQSKQPWAEVETGGTFGFLGVNDAQIKAHKEAKKEFTHEAMSMPVLTEEPRPTSEEIDLGIVPPIAQEIVQEDRVETNEPPILKIMAEEPKQKTLIPEIIPTKNKAEPIPLPLKAITMGENNSFNKVFLPPQLPQFSTPNELSFFQKLNLRKESNLMRESKVNVPPVKFGPEPPLGIPLSLKQEPEPIINQKTNQPLSAETVVIPDVDLEIQKLKKLTVNELKPILSGLGGNVTLGPGKYKKKLVLFEEILEFRKENPAQFTGLLESYKNKI